MPDRTDHIEADRRRSKIGFSIAGTALIILFLAYINFTVGGSFPWFVFPAFAILWWPLALIWGRDHQKPFAVIGSASILAFVIFINLEFSPEKLWCHYVALILIAWPVFVLFPRDRVSKIYSIVGALSLIAAFSYESFYMYPESDWALFTYYPIVMWPVCVFLKDQLGKITVALFFSAFGMGYYLMLNLFSFPGFPWVIYPVYALLWWPMVLLMPRKNRGMILAVAGSILTALLLVVTNLITSSGTLWSVFPVIALCWWPLSVYYGGRFKELKLNVK